MSQADTPVDALLVQYRDLLLQMDAHRVEQGSEPREWNRLVNRMQRVQLQLRATQEGRDGIAALISDKNPTVRSWSAVNALSWAEPEARAELEREIEADEGMLGFEARTALREHDAGRLNTAWEPKSR